MYQLKIIRIMKKFIEIMENDLRTEGFTKKEFWLYGVLLPLCLIVLIGVAGYLFD